MRHNAQPHQSWQGVAPPPGMFYAPANAAAMHRMGCFPPATPHHTVRVSAHGGVATGGPDDQHMQQRSGHEKYAGFKWTPATQLAYEMQLQLAVRYLRASGMLEQSSRSSLNDFPAPFSDGVTNGSDAFAATAAASTGLNCSGLQSA
eukprot:SAG11_NODE_3609_length_2342_cov_1.734730_5_plen_147_part_00